MLNFNNNRMSLNVGIIIKIIVISMIKYIKIYLIIKCVMKIPIIEVLIYINSIILFLTLHIMHFRYNKNPTVFNKSPTCYFQIISARLSVILIVDLIINFHDKTSILPFHILLIKSVIFCIYCI